MTLTEMLHTIVPVSKNAIWLGGIAVSMFLAGVGFMTQAGAFSDLPENMIEVQEKMTEHDLAIDSLRSGLRRIACLSRLSAIGQAVDPLEIDQVCP